MTVRNTTLIDAAGLQAGPYPGGNQKAIESATAASPIAITITAHGYQTGDLVKIDGASTPGAAGGQAGLNNFFIVTRTGANTFTVPFNNTGGATAPGGVVTTQMAFSLNPAFSNTQVFDTAVVLATFNNLAKWDELEMDINVTAGLTSAGAATLDLFLQRSTDPYGIGPWDDYAALTVGLAKATATEIMAHFPAAEATATATDSDSWVKKDTSASVNGAAVNLTLTAGQTRPGHFGYALRLVAVVRVATATAAPGISVLIKGIRVEVD